MNSPDVDQKVMLYSSQGPIYCETYVLLQKLRQPWTKYCRHIRKIK